MRLQSIRSLFYCFLVLVFANSTLFASTASPGPRTVAVDSSDYQHVSYVSAEAGSDRVGDGSRTRPWQTLSHALDQSRGHSESNRCAIFVAAGVYKVSTLEMKSHVDLFGGYDGQHWQRDIIRHRTVLDGGEKYRVLTGADDARLDGFVVQAGRVRGRGAGLLCDGKSPLITNNSFVDNRTRKPEKWSPEHWHEQANDGGAIYCANGAKPVLKNNLFANNTTEIGRGAAIAMHDHCGGEISHSVFLDNDAGTEDLDRSSDGGAISIFNWSSPLIDSNVLLENKAYNRNDGGGMFIAFWSSPVISRNIFVGNRSTDDGGALFVGGQEHRYDSPKDPVPAAVDFCVKISSNVFFGNENGRRNSGGMRLTMQARATVENNLFAHDARFQVQASEAKIINNTILEDTVLEEMPEDTARNLVAQNVFWARLLDRSAKGKKRKLTPDIPRTGEEPRFVDDQQTLGVKSSVYQPMEHVTKIELVSANLEVDQLANRVARFEHRWGVVKSNHTGEIAVWGDVANSSQLVVLPTFQLHPQSPGLRRGPRNTEQEQAPPN